MCTKFYQNRLSFVEDMIKHLVFSSVHSVGIQTYSRVNAGMPLQVLDMHVATLVILKICCWLGL